MTAAIKSSPRITSQLVNGILAIKPLAGLAKNRARNMMIKRAESIGVYWHDEVKSLRSRTESASESALSPGWEQELAQVQNANLVYPDYYVTSFHAYEQGNLSWEAAMEVEVAAHAVHARIWQDSGEKGDMRLRQSFQAVLQEKIATAPQDILDIGCSVGMSTFALQSLYPQADITGVDLSPYFLAIAQYRTHQRERGEQYAIQPSLAPSPAQATQMASPTWIHAAAEATGLPDASFDLVSAHLLFHELPQSAAIDILREARRLLRPGGYLAIMDMNPRSEIYAKMPPYILTLLKSTEPYLDEYFSLNLEEAIEQAGFQPPTVICNTPRHRTVIAQVG
ncbi:class I SAM-dependent methyltransferase [Leptolyngbya ohadii]|uniref:class I SAM-dependent methyltransferase n=1 Tax=Leptolyngbya ohadii TaxID=1962290 RepID=UPI000B59CE30|nr:class I SAM-dependent methyltransferase [Leptolyngbya ohadii]